MNSNSGYFWWQLDCLHIACSDVIRISVDLLDTSCVIAVVFLYVRIYRDICFMDQPLSISQMFVAGVFSICRSVHLSMVFVS